MATLRLKAIRSFTHSFIDWLEFFRTVFDVNLSSFRKDWLLRAEDRSGGVQSLGEEGSDTHPAGSAPCSLLGSEDCRQSPRVLPFGTSWALVPSADGDRARVPACFRPVAL